MADMTEDERNAMQEVVRLCERGFSGYTDRYYSQIIAQMEPHSSDASRRIQAMAATGETLTSPRFAYPHIAAIARSALAKAEA